MRPNWLGIADDDPYGLDHLPYGSAMTADGDLRVVVRIGDRALDLTRASAGSRYADLFAAGTLDALLAAGRETWTAVRSAVAAWFTDSSHRELIEPLLLPVNDLDLRLPFTVADYVDFYASEHHASNVGRIFRPDSEPLTPNWRHLPIGYHGRAGTVIVSGTDIVRPNGQTKRPDGSVRFGPAQRLDIEAEVGFVVGVPSRLGTPVPVTEFREHVFGLCLVNDWSARDIQAWEYVPLGPFLGKSFATSIAGWITPLEALDAAWVTPPVRDPQPLPYLDDTATRSGLALDLQVRVNDHVVSCPPFAAMYWSPAQMLAHLTVNGAKLRTGDLYASGTVSGAGDREQGSLLELTTNAANPLTLPTGEQRGFLVDGDEVCITATAPTIHGRLQLPEVRGRVVAAPGQY